MRRKVLLVDKDIGYSGVNVLRNSGYDVYFCANPEKAKHMSQFQRFGTIIVASLPPVLEKHKLQLQQWDVVSVGIPRSYGNYRRTYR